VVRICVLVRLRSFSRQGAEGGRILPVRAQYGQSTVAVGLCGEPAVTGCVLTDT
jgi:hypothetical protein